jgi:hypothetical protein
VRELASIRDEWLDDALPTLLVDGRHNAPAGAMSVGTLYLRSGLPLGVDWYVYPASMAAWSSDSRVVHDPTELPRSEKAFRDLNANGPRQQATPKPSASSPPTSPHPTPPPSPKPSPPT